MKLATFWEWLSGQWNLVNRAAKVWGVRANSYEELNDILDHHPALKYEKAKLDKLIGKPR